jgi:hypothetical protein
MNTASLAQRLLRFLTVKDLALLPADDALGVCDAMNGGIQEYYSVTPSAYKGTTFSGVFSPASSVTATFTQGSNFFTGWTATSAQKGFTIVAGTDNRQNTIIGPNQMLDVYTGIGGSQTAQVYGDCLHMEQIIERFTSDPVLVDYNRVLIRDENWRRAGIRGVWPGTFQLYPYGSYSFRQVRVPWKYWIERQGESQNGLPPFMLRIDSLPDVEYRVRVEGLLAPTQVQINDLIVPQPLSLDAYVIESTVLPMAAYRLLTHPLFANDKLVKIVTEQYITAVKLAKDRTPDQGSSRNYLGTPRGY